jgi:hypothetical protein
VPIGIAGVDGIIAGIGIAVDVHAGEDGVPCVWRDEAAEGGIEIAGVEVGEAGFGIIPLVQEALAAVNRGARSCQRCRRTILASA